MSMEGSYLIARETYYPEDMAKEEIYTLTGKDNNIGISEVRNLISWLAIKPAREKTKQAIIYRAEKLTEEAQNALLKTLEEPPLKTAIVLVTTKADLLLPTVVSRCFLLERNQERQLLRTEETSDFEHLFQKLPAMSLGERFLEAEKVGKDRVEAGSWLEKVLMFCHHQITEGKNQSYWTAVARETYRSRQFLKANTNVRLVMENLFLKL